MMIVKKRLALGLGFFLVLLLAACGGESSSSDGEELIDGIEDPHNDEVVNIGYSGPLSGPAALYGENTLTGIRLAVEQINDGGGFDVNGQNYMLNLVALDDMYLPNETGTNARRLVQEYDTPAIYIPHSGGIFASQVFNEQEEFIIAAYSSEPNITEQGNDLTVRIPPTYDVYIEPFSEYQMERFGDKIALLPTSSEYGKDWTDALIPKWEELGGEVVYEGSVDFNKDTDFFTIVTNALSEDPDVLFIGGPSEPTALIAKQARELGFEGGFLIMDQAKLDEMEVVLETIEPLEGSVGTLPLIHSEYPGTDEFVAQYNEEHGRNPGSEAGFNFVMTYALVEAMKAAGTVSDTHEIMAHMQAGLDNFPEEKMAYEIKEIDSNGGFSVPLRMGVVEDGEIIEVIPE
ncbi:ABC transporter substrate-binding protein [Desertibacillus haloalkaliphilus]|uniref:ABC transporter substrate-binding protein n=1 Tax=Desertibacillus haloalkaliphilus TaxID=1328930 RepID=UPI001C260EFB|nr:ABC transporter substrate-binding protein [Desertibacillus haloalkaliphilus]MBU8905657.1 ABC transporter substrate-binding protein [Desertibacillus haloalkaliphilus]